MSVLHPLTIRYIRNFERGGSLLIEMEYADGGTLAQLLGPRQTPLSERAVLHVWAQLCSALAHMHSRGVLHRDLKTANVFLTSSLQVKVGDFGISKVNFFVYMLN
jgi:NIMA (never in mitosis gene a)-related kinase 8